MLDFFNTYSSVIVLIVFGALLGLSVYLPLMAGQLSLASPGFYALGGYIAAILSTTVFQSTDRIFPLPYVLIEMGLAAIASAILAIALGIPVLRLRGIYLAIATIAFVEILRIVALNLEITGAAIGIFDIPQPFSSQLGYLAIALPLLLLSMAFLYQLERSQTGRVLRAIREDELAASTMGINLTYYKVLTFTLGAVLAGVVGAISAHFLNTWNAKQGTFDNSIMYLAFVLSGGSRTFIGPIVGGMILTALPEVLRSFAGVADLPVALSQFFLDGRFILYGILIVLSTIFYPQGLITPELLKRLRSKPRRKVKSTEY